MAAYRKLTPVNCFSKFLRACSTFSQRTHVTNEITRAALGCNVSVSGWLHSCRFKGKFLSLRDVHGLVQVRVPSQLLKTLELPPLDSVLRVTGTVQPRPAHHINHDMETGEVDLCAERIEVLNASDQSLPILGKDTIQATDAIRLRFRHLDLRRHEMKSRLFLRSRLLLAMRRFLCERHHFCEVETPTLFGRTPGGAREFVVPTRNAGEFYSLVQSPQQFKQLLMVSGIDRYLQIARCYRDEDSRADRQPEFTQIDLEMSFVTAEHVRALVEDLLIGVWPSLPDHLSPLAPEVPFPCYSYEEAMLRFGTDKPDLRFDFELHQLGEEQGPMVAAFVVPENLLPSKEVVQELEEKMFEIVCDSFSDSWLSKPRSMEHTKGKDTTADSALRKAIEAGDEDAVVVSTGESRMALCQTMGKLRLGVAQFLQKKGYMQFKQGFHFLWITEFPLFETTKEGRLTSAHHPFTAPLPGQEHLLYSKPELVRGNAYDLVCNGMEVAGGSIRIHNPQVQRYVLRKIMEVDPGPLEHLISALGHGCPPHGGIAFGFDRLVAILCGVTSIRDVIAFPKTSEGRDVMSGAPSSLDADTKRYYHIT